MRLLALDGTDTIGGTKLLLNYDGLGVMLNFGLNYSALSRYCDEYKRLNAWPAGFGLERHIFDLHRDGSPVFPSGPEGLHSSGHAPAHHLEELARRINQEVLVPVHTERPEAFETRFGGELRVVRAAKGRWVEI